MKDKIFGVLQRVGRSFMLPIAILPVAGLLLGIGSSFTNQTMLEAYRLTSVIYPGSLLYTVLDIMSKAGSAVFDNLALLFAIGVSIGMAKKEKEVAALSSVVAFLIMHTTIFALINARGGAESMLTNSTASVLGITTLQMGVFGGIIVGLGVAALHNRFYRIELPPVLAFFGGTRFVPIISALVYVLVGILLFFIWPLIQRGISMLGNLVLASGYAGTWIYGIIERALIPFGLHHVFYIPFWQTSVGGSAVIDGVLVQGAQNIYFAELASKSTTVFNVEATRFMAGKFPFMIFGLPGAALAMYLCAKPEKRKVAGSLLISAALTAMLTGITEPLEFTFIFVAPLMYGVHCVLAGLSFMLMHILRVGVGMTFSGGIIDLVLFGVLQGNAKTNWIYIVFVGIAYFFIYWGIFSFMIKKFNYKTPGREDEGEETKLYTRKDVEAAKQGNKQSELIVKGLGGKENISDVDCCATRLRITVKDGSMVSDTMLKQSGASGVILKGNGVQVIYGPTVTVVKSNLEDYLDMHVETKISTVILGAYADGEIVPLDKVEDEVFSQGILGQGIAIRPMAGVIFAPCDGVACNLVDSKHAIGIQTEDGFNLLIHVGIDTVNLKGKHFEYAVKDGDKVKKGDVLIRFDKAAIEKAGYKTVTPLVITDAENCKAIKATPSGKVSAGDVVIEIEF
ncbi:MAG: PTS transporter subunit EIIC [Clostridia bacterium]|nr:PTS transporter subunit EIIC [Clostridia bacterium]